MEFARTYHDPELWLRLGPRVEAHAAERADQLATRKVASYEIYCEQIAYIAALRWVLSEAADLTRIPDNREDDR